MNAPAQIKRPGKERYIPSVKAFLPRCEGEELSLRCSLMHIRDSSSVAAQTCSDEAFPILNHVRSLASDCALSNIPASVLKQMRDELLKLLRSATVIEELAFRISGGGTDAGG